MSLKNTKDKALKSLRSFKDRAVGNAKGLKQSFDYKRKKKGQEATYRMYKDVNDKRGLKDKGNESDPLFRGRVMMKEAQRKALKDREA